MNPNVGDYWVKNNEVSAIYDILCDDDERSMELHGQAGSLQRRGFVPAIVLPLDVAMQIQAEFAARAISAEIDGITDYSRGVRRILTALETATGEKVGGCI